MQYLLNAEIYPLRIRAISSSLVMCFHFVNQYGNSRAVPLMLLEPSKGGLSPAGAFWFFTAITVIGGIWAWFTIPETAGISLENIDNLFRVRSFYFCNLVEHKLTLKSQLPWYKIGIYGAKELEVQEAYAREQMDEKKSRVEIIEHAA